MAWDIGADECAGGGTTKGLAGSVTSSTQISGVNKPAKKLIGSIAASTSIASGVTGITQNLSGTIGAVGDCAATVSAGILNTDRIIAWSFAGVWVNGVKGIPSRAVGITCAPPTYSVDPTGINDSASGINAAITACTSGYAVLLPAGTYRIDSTLIMKSGVTLRGAGPALTIISSRVNGDSIRLAGTSSGYPDTDLVSGYTKGSNTVVVTSAASFAVGDLVIIDELNDSDLVSISGGEGNCGWCSRESGARALGETLRITNIAGTTITLNRPLYYTYKAAFVPQMCLASHAPMVNAGVEDLYLTAYSSSQTDCNGINIYFAYGCWVKDCNVTGIPKKFVYIHAYSQCCEVRFNYIHNGTQFDGDHGYGVNVQDQSSDNLIEDNIFAWTHEIVCFGSAGGAGNVVAYNYGYNCYHYQSYWFIHTFATHGAHTYMNLWEGNVIPKMGFDAIWGSGSHNVVLRNYIRGNCPEVAINNNLSAIVISNYNRYNSFLGNVLAHSGYTGTYTYVDAGHYSIWEINQTDSLVQSTLIRHGNYDYVDDEIKWDADITEHTLPNSYYLDSKPSWFGGLTWPTYEPESGGFDPDNLNKNPAQYRFELADYFADPPTGGDIVELAGTSDAAAGFTGNARETREIVGALSGISSLASTLWQWLDTTPLKRLREYVPYPVQGISGLAAKFLEGFLTTLAGTFAALATLTGISKIQREVTGTSTVASSLEAPGRRIRWVDSSIAGQAGFAGVAKRLRELIGNLASAGGATAAAKIRKTLAGASATISGLIAIIGRTVPTLQAVINGISGLASRAKRHRRLPGTSATATAITGLVYEHRKIVGLSGGVAVTSGVMKRGRGVAGTVSGAGSLSAWAKIRKALVSTWAGVSTVAGLLASTVLATWPVIHNAIARVRIAAANARDRIKTSTRD